MLWKERKNKTRGDYGFSIGAIMHTFPPPRDDKIACDDVCSVVKLRIFLVVGWWSVEEFPSSNSALLPSLSCRKGIASKLRTVNFFLKLHFIGTRVVYTIISTSKSPIKMSCLFWASSMIISTDSKLARRAKEDDGDGRRNKQPGISPVGSKWSGVHWAPLHHQRCLVKFNDNFSVRMSLLWWRVSFCFGLKDITGCSSRQHIWGRRCRYTF